MSQHWLINLLIFNPGSSSRYTHLQLNSSTLSITTNSIQQLVQVQIYIFLEYYDDQQRSSDLKLILIIIQSNGQQSFRNVLDLGAFFNWPQNYSFLGSSVQLVFPIQALYDWNRDPAKISKEMQCVLVCYSSLFMRWALRISPQSYILFCMHLFNATLQGRLLIRRLTWESTQQKAIEDKPTN